MSTNAGRQVQRTTAATDLVAAAREMIPYLREQAAQCEIERRVCDATIDKFLRAGLFDVVKPRRYGGFEIGWDVFSEIILELASGCGSSGWVYCVVGAHSAIVARFGTQLLDEIWLPNPDALLSSCRRASGEVARVNGGYRGTVKGIFSSGCLNAQWVIVEGVPVRGEERRLTLVVPMREVEILDTWRVVGLAGTGSNDLQFHDLFIPEHRTWFPGKPPQGDSIDGAIFRTPFLGGPLSLPSVVLGIAIGGLEQFAAMTTRRSSREGVSVADQQSMQMRIGESAIQIDAARALLRAKLKEIMAALAGESAAGEQSVLPAGGTSRYDQTVASFIAHAGYEALDRLMSAAGASQLAAAAPFQRCFRDALAGTQQPSNNWDNGRTEGGREILQRCRPRPG